ncbi:S41 family peptidase [Aneurinibacillus thermoaerophilus]|uniref:S41 family peptidase n=1 Tax=Aneurinibacillus thermoaerophilus TaxID=143495 RepID=A0ABX8YBH3_ANETH|nr:S41 family peptidase [Aneurinibacillus thermoaerophilus]MED0676892.1 S41 family peptidase [Aneurinibacillus thermoaerophilus]MED0758009.1 S41 family peptidase [Aneurinibacillus thermoaerophilus]MED0762350.1 S41 family peptidase [Aneurinibacillus thermoaerophilus]QYY42474.1 S41 family peptidase [Aneurinibacillus thermoaerophilus]
MYVKRRTLFVMLLLVVVSTSIVTLAAAKFFGQGFGQNGTRVPEGQAASGQAVPQNPDFAKVYEAYQLIENTALEKQDKAKLIDGAIEGMVKTLDDPFSDYMNQKETKDFNSSLQSTFEGIGAEVTLKNDRVTIVSPIKGSPAEKAGLRPEDQILKVNGKSLQGMSLSDAVMHIRGPKGTKAELEIMRPGLSEPLRIVVIRDDIPIETVYSETIQRDGKTFGKLEITQFSQDTAKHFANELQKLEEKGIDGLIVDVRGNPGGLLDSVVEIGNLLVPDKGIILQIQYSDGKKEVFRSEKGKAAYPIVVLTDKGSASASEILAAALQSSGYKVVGTNTFGKGTVQNTMPLEDDSQLKITVAKWLTPDGTWIHKKGVIPDVKIEQPDYFKAVLLPDGVELKRDMTSSDVKNLQLILKGLGQAPGRMDGYFDARTEAAVKIFQNLHQLPMTGKVDKKTAGLMQEELIKRIRDPKNDLQLQAAIEVLSQQTN